MKIKRIKCVTIFESCDCKQNNCFYLRIYLFLPQRFVDTFFCSNQSYYMVSLFFLTFVGRNIQQQVLKSLILFSCLFFHKGSYYYSKSKTEEVWKKKQYMGHGLHFEKIGTMLRRNIPTFYYQYFQCKVNVSALLAFHCKHF